MPFILFIISKTTLGYKNQLHESMSSKPDHVIVHPVRVDHVGGFLSHQLNNFVSVFDAKLKTEHNHSSGSGSDRLYYSLEVEGRSMVLNVSSNNRLLHPNFVVERRYKGEKRDELARDILSSQRSSIQRGTNSFCHLRGHVIGHPESSVAVSTCRGLVSWFCYFID